MKVQVALERVSGGQSHWQLTTEGSLKLSPAALVWPGEMQPA